MRSRMPLVVLLASSLTFLASLYLPWHASSLTTPGWTDIASLVGITLAGMAAAGVARPALVARLPLGRGALTMSYFAVAEAVKLARWEHEQNFRYHYAAGSYLALTSCVVALGAALALRRTDLRRPSPVGAVTSLLGLGLLVSYLLPWGRTTGDLVFVIPSLGVQILPNVLAALVLWLGLGFGRRAYLLPTALAVAVLTGASLAGLTGWDVARLYGAWIGLGFALALLAVAVVAGRRDRPRRVYPLLAGTGALLALSLFLPWPEVCYPQTGCFSTDGWWLPPGATAGLAALALVAVPLFPWLERHVVTLVLALAVFVLSLGLAFSSIGTNLGYGAFLGFAATGLLLLLAAFSLRGARLERERLLLRLPPIAGCLVYVAAVVVPWWNVLPLHWEERGPSLPGWLSVAAVLLALELVVLWCRSSRPTGPSVVLLPIVCVALAILGVVQDRASGVTWGSWLALCLPALLAVAGWIENGGDPRRLPLPELLRVDRLPGVEG